MCFIVKFVYFCLQTSYSLGVKSYEPFHAKTNVAVDLSLCTKRFLTQQQPSEACSAQCRDDDQVSVGMEFFFIKTH